MDRTTINQPYREKKETDYPPLHFYGAAAESLIPWYCIDRLFPPRPVPDHQDLSASAASVFFPFCYGQAGTYLAGSSLAS
jgi:hypothetical protein